MPYPVRMIVHTMPVTDTARVGNRTFVKEIVADWPGVPSRGDMVALDASTEVYAPVIGLTWDAGTHVTLEFGDSLLTSDLIPYLLEHGYQPLARGESKPTD